jgi:5-methylcytosine-specific restriction endonuclease McrA
MNLRILKDKELLEQTKIVAQSEREILTKMLHHLREIDRRKLFSDLGYQSLFAYAVKELKYTEGQAGRRIQAMRLIREIPEIEWKIESGNLNLINVSQVQSLFREAKRASILVSKSDKLSLLRKLENKSKLEGQKIIENMRPVLNLKPKLEDKTEISLSDETKNKISELRSLLGNKGSQMSLTELVEFMADHTVESLKIRKFGKKQILSRPVKAAPLEPADPVNTSTVESVKTPLVESPKSSRQISRKVKFEVWTRDRGKCKKCGGSSNLNYDHIQPAALGGGSTLKNLRLLCFSCNQRRAIKTFGFRADCERH